MQEMENELRALRQASREGAGQATLGSSVAIAMGQDEPTTGGPKCGVSLKEWVGMKMDNFDGSCTPVQAADWLSYVEDKMEAFEVLAQDRVRYGTQLLKGEAQIWWKAHDEVEKARQFRQGLKPAIRHVLGAFSITDFCSMVEQALGVEMQLMYTTDLYKSSVVSSLGVREIERAILVVRVIRRGSLNVTMLIVWYSSDDGSASFFSRARVAYTSIPVATFRYSTGPYTLVWGLLVAPRHYSFNTRGSLGSCTGCSYCGSLFFD
ncbi:hypothetical protein E2562_035874 [Oryza meyeriana var. granulata]|uniref:Retrotransposon gag domain-containing protein n=1 Tax=Oryza meyeriana var. granulata TaxID=110450 RepID=A0A6G1ESQ9_9ORYZ|nr:hypothetical protein E2562_035874 [Oryza meyeriana var. granulata]